MVSSIESAWYLGNKKKGETPNQDCRLSGQTLLDSLYSICILFHAESPARPLAAITPVPDTDSMSDFLARPITQVVLWMAALMVLMAIGYSIVRRFRDRIDEDVQAPNEWLDNFREMHAEGDISEGEFRKVKKVLDAKVQIEPGPADPDEVGTDRS
jgi:flagellar biosynthesis/type III secretory pathway M-ring protein FliF/YscJ